MRMPTLSRLPGEGAEIQVYEWPGDGPGVLLAHATGFHGRCWQQVVERLPGLRVIAVDLRGHGLSDKPEPPYDWRNFGLDTAAVARALGLRNALGVGHSCGGAAIFSAAIEAPEIFGAILGVDPVIGDPERYGNAPGDGSGHFSAKRRDRFASPEEMYERFKGRAPYDRWDPAALRDYVEYGLLPAPDGDGFVLACPPRIEAAVYGGAPTVGAIAKRIGEIAVPVHVLRVAPSKPGAMDMSGSPTWPGLAGALQRGSETYLPDLTHFIPMEAPDLVAAKIEEMAGVLA